MTTALIITFLLMNQVNEMITYKLILEFESEHDRKAAIEALENAEAENEIKGPFATLTGESGPINELLEQGN